MTLQASLLAQTEASLKQAQGANKVAQSLMAQKSDCGDSENEIITKLKEELESIKVDRDAVKSQAESVTKEYDRLMAEYEKLQKTVGSESKKDN